MVRPPSFFVFTMHPLCRRENARTAPIRMELVQRRSSCCFDQSASDPYHNDSQYDAQAQIESECCPVAILNEQVDVVGERREGGETPTETCNQKDVHRGREHVHLLGQPEEDTDQKTSDHIDDERPPREVGYAGKGAKLAH